jgi:hypothetical protein
MRSRLAERSTSFIEKCRSIYRKKRAKLIGIKYYKTLGKNLNTTGNSQFRIISDYDEFEKYMHHYSIDIPKEHHERFVNGDKYACIFSEKDVLSSGWICSKDEFYIAEIDITISIVGTTMLYDFVTPEQMRNKGFYKEILGKIAQCYPTTQLAIFARKNNKASIHAIEKVGFKAAPYIKK